MADGTMQEEQAARQPGAARRWALLAACLCLGVGLLVALLVGLVGGDGLLAWDGSEVVVVDSGGPSGQAPDGGVAVPADAGRRVERRSGDAPRGTHLALVLILDTCEMPDGAYWAERCGLTAVQTLSERDELGIITYDWQAGGARWDFPLQPKGDGSSATAAIKAMRLGEMVTLQDALDLALNGDGGHAGLAESDAGRKHVIIISDDDPAGPAQGLYQHYLDAGVSASTVCVFPHRPEMPPVMREIPQRLAGRAHGPVVGKFEALPALLVNEIEAVRRGSNMDQRPEATTAPRPAAPATRLGPGAALPQDQTRRDNPVTIAASGDAASLATGNGPLTTDNEQGTSSR